MINFFIPTKKTLLLMIGMVILIIILAFISWFSPSEPDIPPQPSPSPLSSRTITNNLPNSTAEPEPSPERVYSPEVLQEDYERLNANIPLAQADSEIRNRLISSLNNQSGFLEQTPEYNMKYIKTRDIFMVEILSNSADQAKTGALGWFFSQGLSSEGICNLPVSIYLNSEVKNYLASQNKTFNPIPEGCQ